MFYSFVLSPLIYQAPGRKHKIIKLNGYSLFRVILKHPGGTSNFVGFGQCLPFPGISRDF